MKRIIGIAIAVAGLGWLIWLLAHGPAEAPGTETAQERARYELTDIQWLRMDDEGRPLHRLRSDEMLMYADGSATVQTVVIDQLGEHDGWNLTAPYGDVPPGGEVLTLRGGVQLLGNWADEQPLEGESDTLSIDTRARELRTDDPVVLAGPGRNISGRGLRADWDGERINLEHDVRLQYDQAN